MDLIITDPPFGIKFDGKSGVYNRKSSKVMDGYVEIPQKEYRQFSEDWIKEAYRILKPNGSIYIFSGFNNLEDVLRGVRLAGFTVVNHIIWKYQFGVNCQNKYVTSHYTIIYAVKNPKKKTFNTNCRFSKYAKTENGNSARYRDVEDVWTINREFSFKGDKTPTKLPSEIVKKILQYSSNPGDLVFDPFLGSGQVILTARKMNRNYMGIEIVKKYFEVIGKRLEGLK